MTEPMPYLPPQQPLEPSSETAEPADPTPATRRSWLPPVAAGVAGVAVGAVVTAAIMSSGSSSPAAASIASATPASSASAPAAPTSAGAKRAHGVRGVITAENGSTWTVRSQAGPTVTVTIATTTKFGTKKVPASKSQFVANSPVVIVGKRSGDKIAARRVIKPAAGAGKSRPAPSASPTS